MADSNESYLGLITSEYATKDLFYQYVKTFLDEVSPVVDMLMSFDTIFNLDNAVGDQLDLLGELVGMTRNLPLSVTDIPSTLTDDLFRTVIKARIYSNHWDGTYEGWVAIIQALYPNTSFSVVDNQDMTIDVYIIQTEEDATKLALLLNGYIVPKPAGVLVNYTVQEGALFGYDSDTSFIKGWDEGIWGNE